MWPNPQIPADLVTFTEEILNRKLNFLCSNLYSKTFTVHYFNFPETLVLNHLECCLVQIWDMQYFPFKKELHGFQ